MTKKNPQTIKEQYNAVIDSMDTSQLASSNNRINMDKVAEDSAYNLGNFRTPESTEKSKSTFESYAEMSRFNRDHSETARKLTKRID